MTTTHDMFQEVEHEGRTYGINFCAEGSLFSSPGKYYGPPEHCYPEESECEITSIEIISCTDEDELPVTDPTLLDKLKTLLSEDLIDEALWQAYGAEAADNFTEPDLDY